MHPSIKGRSKIRSRTPLWLAEGGRSQNVVAHECGALTTRSHYASSRDTVVPHTYTQVNDDNNKVKTTLITMS